MASVSDVDKAEGLSPLQVYICVCVRVSVCVCVCLYIDVVSDVGEAEGSSRYACVCVCVRVYLSVCLSACVRGHCL